MATKKSSIWDKKIAKNTQKQKRDTSSSSYIMLPKDVKMFNPEPEGRVKLDFLPYEVTDPRHMDRDPETEIAMPGTLWYKHPYKSHRGIGVEQDSVICLTSIGKKCPICEYRAKLLKEGAEREVTDALKPSLRNLYIVVPLNSKKHEVEIHIMDISQAMFQKQLNADLDEREENRRFPDLEEGKTLDVRFESTTFSGSKPFPKANRIDFDDRKDQYDESVLEKVPNLDEVLKVLSYEELSTKFFEMEDDTDTGHLKEVKDEEPDEERSTDRKKNPLAAHHVEKEEDEAEDTHTRKMAGRKPSNLAKHDKKEELKEEEKEPEGPSWEDLLTLSGRKLTRFCDDNKLELDPDKYDENDDLRKAIATELDIEMPKAKRVPSAEKETKKEPEKKASTGKDKCPFGHVFGKDTSKFKDCDDCKIWDDCDEENLKQKKA